MSALLKISGLNKSYGQAHILKNVDLEVKAGEVLGVIGRSGCGKSTLLRCINGLEAFDSGSVEIAGHFIGRVPVSGDRWRQQSGRELAPLRAEIGFVFQQFHLWTNKTAIENVALPQVRVLKRSWNEANERAASLLDDLGLADKKGSYPSQLSGGQQQRVSIARALAMEPKLMLLDEPTSALDPELVGEVLNALQKLVAAGMTMVCVTHELGFVKAFGTRLIFMDHGEIAEEGPPAELLSAPRSQRLAALIGSIQH
ncbi:amino acid ABC transporter ATP-binding protein [Aureimonas mangrovi]|uniref:amino acid ABC transporter ATP-binding protein n=1 Tax=Aureimonas mangrovi TaxID=2758041 RepID=UPI00163D7FCF|nr:amino acid ABC transporter ATP-binding protein [Aureimonas mangrovi]